MGTVVRTLLNHGRVGYLVFRLATTFNPGRDIIGSQRNRYHQSNTVSAGFGFHSIHLCLYEEVQQRDERFTKDQNKDRFNGEGEGGSYRIAN